ncbi:hypothetical protein A374_04509 [Fictibacillus macauensis ZFHKF-1]|uniref:YxiS n=1 Tax=Fictibacillus macauensis ZFHKF-1 TaxID=1196324 RepID=I8J4T8_9BACL|nr:hypothetical protein [Fictibacillus macauensis]EIT86806.1 hypothetical protein A374_04509 [Fictibacillus macauensis ZFHKF-1]
MNSEEVIKNYKDQEAMMVLLFAQWCTNHGYDPIALYTAAYPDQPNNEALQRAIHETVAKEEEAYVPDELLLQVLSSFGNEELAFVITEKMKGRKK